MDYLVSHGCPLAAQKFAAEANIQPLPDLDSITQRVEIREAIHSGDIQTAIEKINELNPEVSDAAWLLPQLYTHFHYFDDDIDVHAPLIVLLGLDEKQTQPIL